MTWARKTNKTNPQKLTNSGEDPTSHRQKKSAAEKVLLDQHQSQTVVKLVQSRLKKIAKKGGTRRKGKEVKRLRSVASVLGTDFRLKWSKDKEKYVVAAHVVHLS